MSVIATLSVHYCMLRDSIDSKVSCVACVCYAMSALQFIYMCRYSVDSVSDLSPLRKEPCFYRFTGVVTSLTVRETFT